MKTRILILCCFIGLFSPLHGQDSLSFIKYDKNSIQNQKSLATFFEKLYQLKSEGNNRINILHLGDSHIQADILTQTTRTLLQKEFGNAGLGLVLPGKVARTNESPLIKSTSTGTWEVAKLTQQQPPFPIGVGGISLLTKTPGNKIQIGIKKESSHAYSFDRVKLFFDKDFKSFDLLIKDSVGNIISHAGSYSDEPFKFNSNLRFAHPIKEITIETTQANKEQTQFIWYGISLENSTAGIIYHALGVNGATYKSYLIGHSLIEQIKALYPDLIIISLGTNEAANYPYIDKQFNKQVSQMINQFKSNNPATAIIITTPADYYRKRTKRNPGVNSITQELIQVANKNQVAYWDLFAVAGGRHAADKWKGNNLLQSDGIHFTQDGYMLQGKLLYDALMKGYKDYVFNRHP